MPAILADRPPLLAVGSGDGTIATVVDYLAHSDTVLGYLPLGTTDNFGRNLDLPMRLPAAVEVIATRRVADVDLSRANGDLFANLVSIGIWAAVAGNTPAPLKPRIGRGAYAATAAARPAQPRPLHGDSVERRRNVAGAHLPAQHR